METTAEVVQGKTEILMTAQEYAETEGCTARTVRNWIKNGRVEVVFRNGKRFINAAEPIRPARQQISLIESVSSDFPNSHELLQSQTRPRESLIEKFLKDHAETGRYGQVLLARSERQRLTWQILSFVVMALFVATLIIAACSVTYLIQNNTRLAQDASATTTELTAAKAEIVTLQSQLFLAHDKVSGLTDSILKLPLKRIELADPPQPFGPLPQSDSLLDRND